MQPIRNSRSRRWLRLLRLLCAISLQIGCRREYMKLFLQASERASKEADICFRAAWWLAAKQGQAMLGNG